MDDMKTLFERHPHTVVLTCTLKGERVANEVALKARFGRRRPLVTLPGDVKQNPENYNEAGVFRADRKPMPAEIPIYCGMKVVLTQNIRKEADFVNGQDCEVEDFDDNDTGGALRVMTATGQRLAIFRWTDTEHMGANYFPIRVGYASTIHKAQGGEFPHVSVWLDAKFMPAAAYTALSRVAESSAFLLAGKLKRHHFVPASFTHPSQYKG